jgi:hypothetical protein
MSMILELIGGRKTLYGLAVGLFLGLLIGWWLLGVVLFPVDWEDAAPVDLHPTYRKEVVRAIADAYSVHGNAELAKAFLSERWEKDDLTRVIGELKADATDDAAVQRLDALAQVLEIPAVPAVTVATPAPTPEQPSIVGRLLPLCGVFLLVVAVLALAGLAVRILRSRRAVREEAGSLARMREAISPEMVGTMPSGALLGHFLTSYSLGNDHYEEAFSIETEDGYLGECGVAISESIGVGPPDKVTAFEVWLFDKNDVRTETKVLMSTHAFNDEAFQARLATRGDLVLAEFGKIITLETASLQVTARITEMEYGNGDMPEESFFSRITLELAASLKQGGGDAGMAAFGQPPL